MKTWAAVAAAADRPVGVGSSVVAQERARKRVVVLDASALIGPDFNPARLASAELVTVAEVLSGEVRDAEARRRLELLRIETRVPSKAAVLKVVEFANRTGDGAVLSGTDIKLIALTRMLEVEMNGTANVRDTPLPPKPVSRPRPPPVGTAEEEQPQQQQEPERDTFYDNVVEGVEDEDDEASHHADPCGDAVPDVARVVTAAAAAAPPTAAPLVVVESPATSKELRGDSDLPGWGEEWVTSAAQLGDRSGASRVEAVDDASSVACLTTDFAMQNVLLQMGLRVIAPDGRRVTRVKQWALRCFTCTCITRAMEKLFCPRCGNSTLKRVSVSVEEDGAITAYFNPKNKISKRGSKFPVPKPVGGRAPKFITDECELPKAQSKPLKQTEYAFGDQRNRAPEKPKLGYGKKNPNEARKRTGKKKSHHAAGAK